MKRGRYLDEIGDQFKIHPVCALLGPRQVGKTTLAKMYVEKFHDKKAHFFDLENPLDLARLENPMLALSYFKDHLLVIDEIQRKPELFPILRVLADDQKKNNQYLILGSASRDLIRQSSESLAGRIGYIELTPFSIDETGESEKLWVRGGYPRSFLANNESESSRWREDYVTTFLERDIPLLGFQIPPEQIRRFWQMLTHFHGQIFNATEIACSLGVSDHTVRRYLDILVGTFMVRLLQPWYENIGKRQTKSSKIYFRDSGIYHSLIGVQNFEALQSYPKLGSDWEGFALEETIRMNEADSNDCYFWRTHSGVELDLLIIKNGKRHGYEFKYTDSPETTRSMQVALNDLNLDSFTLVFPGKDRFPLTDKIIAQGLDFSSD
jgi:hypothetical protein